MTYKRRRQSTMVTTAMVVAASLISCVSGEGEEDALSHRQTASLIHQVDDGSPSHLVDDDGNDHANDDLATEEEHPDFHRRLQLSAAETFASFTPEKIARAIPLDLKIDEDSGRAYTQGLHGYLQPYASTFANGGSGGHGEGDGGNKAYWDSILDVENIIKDGESISHTKSAHRMGPNRPQDRLYYKILEEDGITVNSSNSQGLRGRRELMDGVVQESSPIVISLNSLTFRTLDEFGEEEEDTLVSVLDEEEDNFQDIKGRALQGVSHGKSNAASAFAASSEQAQTSNPEDQSTHLMTPHGDKRQNKNNKNNTQKNKNAQQKNKKKLPTIKPTLPKPGDVVRGTQTFRAKVGRAQSTGAPVQAVTFQLIDEKGSKSDRIDMDEQDDGLWEVTVQGFDKHQGTTWCYQVQAKDSKGKRRSSECIPFTIEGVGDSSKGFADGGADNSEPSPSTGSTELMAQIEATDSDWNKGGKIQHSTGRVLFEFDDTGQVYVCTGTVIRDGPKGQTINSNNDRTLIATAAHCAYSDVYKRFAKRAMFIPDQVKTTGDKSDFDCGNDPLGCWHLSWAVVANGWSDASFPVNVEWDYAMYVVHNDPSTHSGGYERGVTGNLERDVTPMLIDFEYELNNDFIYSIGYSADKDPSLRHCAEKNSEINGIAWYTNFWLDNCAMTGGASGGPWIKDMTEDGEGTIISVNSWGFSHKAGMAGPRLRTQDGSWAECLFNKARRASDAGRDGGYIVTSCN